MSKKKLSKVAWKEPFQIYVFINHKMVEDMKAGLAEYFLLENTTFTEQGNGDYEVCVTTTIEDAGHVYSVFNDVIND